MPVRSKPIKRGGRLSKLKRGGNLSRLKRKTKSARPKRKVFVNEWTWNADGSDAKQVAS